MPLLGIFSKKSNSRSKSSTTASNAGHGASNISLDDDDYVSVASPNSEQHGSPSNPQYRRGPGQAQLHPPHSQLPYLDPLLEPPPRRSSLFQNFQDEPSALRSTQSLPDSGDRRVLRSSPHPQQVLQEAPRPAAAAAAATNATPKRSMFSWKSNKDRSKSAPSVKQSEDSSFNLKSFRHVRPDSPSSLRPSLPPIPTPTPTSAIPSPPISFQVTSRRPQGNFITDPTASPSQQTTASQQKMAAGAFRQAARRSSTSLTLTDSPVLSPVSPTRSSLDDRPPPSLLPPALGRPSTPTRSPGPTNTTISPRPSTPTRPPRPQPPSATSHVPPPTSTTRIRTNAFAVSSSSSSSEEDEDEDEDSTDDGAGLTRKTTIKPRAGTLPPLSATVREQIQRATPPADPAPPRAQSSLGVYGMGARQRASMSVGALTPSAKEARASIAIAANTRLMNAPRPPSKATPAPAQAPSSGRAPGSDTSESVADSDSDEDAPLSSLVPPRRPGTAMSSHSAPGGSHKPLVDLEAPSTLTGRPIRAPPPISREDNTRSKRASVDFAPRTSSPDYQIVKMSPTSSSHSPRMSQAPSSSRISLASQGSRASQTLLQQGPKLSPASQSSRASQISSHHPSRPSPGRSLVNLDTSVTSQSATSRSNLSPPSPPMRPFARRESPASSTGDSSSGKAPLTPRDGSDLGAGARSAYSSSASRGRQGHGRKPSVTFEDEQENGKKGKSRERDNVNPQEARLRERRRTEARAAIELGNVVNGPPPVDDDDVTLGQHPSMQMGWGQQGMQIPMPPVAPMYNMGMNMPMPSPGAFGFGAPSPGGDAAYLAAHQQAMLIAKQTFQYAVAQQALAAANEEWERNSNAGAQWSGSQWGGGSAYGMGMGMGMGMRSSTMFPPAPRSMYAGSAGGGGGGAGWGGAGSVYGEPFGPARQSVYSQVDLSAAANAQQRPTRPRTKTAPSAPAPPAGLGRMPAPPSSFRGVGH